MTWIDLTCWPVPAIATCWPVSIAMLHYSSPMTGLYSLTCTSFTLLVPARLHYSWPLTWLYSDTFKLLVPAKIPIIYLWLVDLC